MFCSRFHLIHGLNRLVRLERIVDDICTQTIIVFTTQLLLHMLSFDGRLKINCVVMNGVNTDELADFLEFTRDQELDVRFIEWMPFDDNRWKDAKFFSYQVGKTVVQRPSSVLDKFSTLTYIWVSARAVRDTPSTLN